jgi:sulfoxide reductase heme-binding subunit YedZ
MWLIFGALQNNLGVNPVETLTRTTGDWAMYFLLMTLAVTPLRRRFSQLGGLIHYRRMLGLYAFFYASVHLMTYVWFDQFFDVAEIVRDIIKRPFITLGMLSFGLLIPLALTSTQSMMRRLKQNWVKLHRLVYLIAILVMIHYFMMIKADYKEFLIFMTLLMLLLGSRVVNASSKQKASPLR